MKRNGEKERAKAEEVEINGRQSLPALAFLLGKAQYESKF